MGSVGSRLKEFREFKNLSQEEFAKEIGVSQGNITHWETDRRKPARKLNLIIKRFPELNIAWLMNGESQMTLPERPNKNTLLLDKNQADFEEIMALIKQLEKEIKDRDETIKSLQKELIDLYKNK